MQFFEFWMSCSGTASTDAAYLFVYFYLLDKNHLHEMQIILVASYIMQTKIKVPGVDVQPYFKAALSLKNNPTDMQLRI